MVRTTARLSKDRNITETKGEVFVRLRVGMLLHIESKIDRDLDSYTYPISFCEESCSTSWLSNSFELLLCFCFVPGSFISVYYTIENQLTDFDFDTRLAYHISNPITLYCLYCFVSYH